MSATLASRNAIVTSRRSTPYASTLGSRPTRLSNPAFTMRQKEQARFRPLPSLSRGEDASTSGSVSFESYARTALAMSDADVEKVLAHTPKLAGYDVTGAIAPKVDHLCQELGADVARVRRAVQREPRLLTVSLDRLESTACWLTDECGVNRGDVGAILCKQPSVAWSSVDANLRPTMTFLVEELGMSPTAVARAVKRRPSILLMNVDDNLRAKKRYFTDRLGLGEETVRAVLEKNPEILALSVEDSVAKTVEFFARDLGIGGDRAIKLITKAPAVLSLSLERNIVPTIDFLADELDLGIERAIKCIETRPQLLAYSLERKLRPTVRYLVDEFFPACDVYDAVQLVNYSLKGRIIPRVRILRRKGMMSEQALHKPSYVVCMRDDQFQKLAGVTPEEYAVEVARAKDGETKDVTSETAGAR